MPSWLATRQAAAWTTTRSATPIGSLTVSQKALTVTANSATKTYGDTVTFAGTEFTTDGLVNGDSVSGVTLTSDGAAATAQVSGSPYAIVASDAAGSGLDNYTISYTNGSLTVSQKALTVTANSTTKTYGDTVTFAGTEFTTDGLVNGDSVSGVTLTSDGAAATAQVSGSPYAIVASDAAGSGLDNYTISYTNGSLTVSQKALTVTANSTTKTYGDTVTFAGTEFTTDGLVNGDSVTGVTLTSDGAAATAQVSGSPYAIVASDAAGSGLDNYRSATPIGSLTVTPATLIVTANNTTMVLGGPVPTFSAYYIGLVNGDTVSSLGNLNLSFTPGSTTVSGTSTITLSGNATSTDSDYTIVYDPGTLTVNTPTKPIIIGLPPSKKLS